MCTIPVFYATTHGQTRRIAERIAEALRREGHASFPLDLTSETARHFDWRRASAAVLSASLHTGRHQSSAVHFARTHVDRLNAIPTWFVSVSLSAASAHAEERSAAERLAREFVESVGWAPGRVSCVAGMLAYTRYSFVTRWFMRRIARKEGASTDTSRDHEFTDWSAVALLSRQFGREVWNRVQARGVRSREERWANDSRR
ncbi:Protoporphyrinogen IX dehydrogenase [menaquinone] [Luteitalea pratensis]|uniref:Protoporphyrinogen IX dehydrogenase [menaquinone] n=1 Tax=Luteitalea pratensis TaxID=1855912 RepID=A0A143PQP4_LUTPR|nr:flavodoxin domain-containing protein [Luteitalea pratensis]AMY10751.1 Protoporphyrinogen IX dehydrogenase [menaquinone] [Luteitalea pratensis]